MSALINALPDRWRNARTGPTLMRLGIIGLTLVLAFYLGRTPTLQAIALPAVLVAGWLILMNPHWGIPLIIISSLLVPFVIGTGTGSSLNAPFLLVPLLAGIWLVRMLMAGKLHFVPTSANWALIGLVTTPRKNLRVSLLWPRIWQRGQRSGSAGTLASLARPWTASMHPFWPAWPGRRYPSSGS